MNFVWFSIILIAWAYFSWQFLLFVFGGVSHALDKLLDHHIEKAKYDIKSIIGTFFAYFLGIFLPSILYGGGFGFIALRFTEKINHPLPYLLIAGVICCGSVFPRIIWMILSCLSYVIFIFNPGIINSALVKDIFWLVGGLFHMSLWAVGWLLILAIVFWVLNKFRKKDQ